MAYYKIKIIEHHNLERDPNYPCIDYKIPGDYGNCLEEEILKENSKFVNCTPPWMTDNEDLWCKGHYKLNPKISTSIYGKFLYSIAISGPKQKHCLIPCKTKLYQVKAIGLKKSIRGTGFQVWIENEVDVIKSLWTMDARIITSNIGGFIGIGKEFLWISILTVSAFSALMLKIRCPCIK